MELGAEEGVEKFGAWNGWLRLRYVCMYYTSIHQSVSGRITDIILL